MSDRINVQGRNGEGPRLVTGLDQSERLLMRRQAALKKLGADPALGGRNGLVFGASNAARVLGVSLAALKKLVSHVGTATNPHHRSGPPVGLYDPLDLFRVSKQKRAQTAKARTVGRAESAKKAVETKTGRLLDVVNALEIRVDRLPLEEVRRLAIEHYNERRRPDKDRADASSSEDFLLRITVNYVRHEMTVYDGTVAALWGRTGKEEALDLLRERIYGLIARTYPELAEECESQEIARIGSAEA